MKVIGWKRVSQYIFLLLSFLLYQNCGSGPDSLTNGSVSSTVVTRASFGDNFCSVNKVNEILEPASKRNDSVFIDCSVKLERSDLITKKVVFSGGSASNVTFDCNGATLDSRSGAVNHNKAIVEIVSERISNNNYSRPENVMIKNCKIYGSSWISGMKKNIDEYGVKPSSYRKGHIERAQKAAPKNITFEDVTIYGQGNTGGAGGTVIYVSQGVTYFKLVNSKIYGAAKSAAIYLDAESANHSIVGNLFDIKTGREVVAVDGSAKNDIKANVFKVRSRVNAGAIYLYRNCGEKGTVRHQTPHHNIISQNHIEFSNSSTTDPAIWLGSREGNRPYCHLDNGFSFGSSKSNLDYARNNAVSNNIFKGVKLKYLEGKSARENRIEDAVEKPSSNNVKTINFSCKKVGSNAGCIKKVSCPSGKKLISLRAICDLEAGSVSAGLLERISWGSLKVNRESDNRSNGLCSLGIGNKTYSIKHGFTSVRSMEGSVVEARCKEYDKNGGDCEIRGQIRCQ